MKKFIILVVMAAGGLAVYFGFYNESELALISDTEPVESTGTITSGPAAVFSEPVNYGSLKEQYSGNGFSFKYSEGFKVFYNQIQGGEVVTVENTKGSGFQIFSMRWDESDPITPERIWQDEPDADVLEPKNADLDGVRTLVFYGYNEDMGETFEAWVVYKGKLYQIAGPKTAQQLVIETLETWSWK